MNDFTQVWGNANPDAVGNDNEPPDPALGPLFDVTLADTKADISKAGDPYFVLDWKIVAGPLLDYQWDHYNGFKSQAQANISKKVARDLGVDVDALAPSIEALHAALGEKRGQYYVVEVKQNGEYRNVYVQEGSARESDIPMDLPPVPVPPESDSVPFHNDGFPSHEERRAHRSRF